MLRVTIPARESWDPVKEEFIYSNETTLQLEHSLVSLSKWESKWCKPFLGKEKKTYEESIDYIRCMTLTQNVNPSVYYNIPDTIFNQIMQYIDAPMTATTFSDKGKGGSREIVTAEIIYYWMISLNIPFECQKWHLNRLLTLIKVCSIKNTPPKKMSKNELMSRNRSLNAARKSRLHSRG